MINALSFTLLEASLSAFFSVLLGVILARIWMRRDIRHREALESLILLPFFLPPLFVVLAVLRFYGQQGLGFSVFGLTGIVIAHMILNIPLAFYMVLQEWRRVPLETLEMAESLGKVSRLIEAPLLRKSIPNAFGLIFLYSSLSFTIVLTLGRGANATTLELGIYQAIRFDFDLGKAFSLALAQAALGFCIFVFVRNTVEAPIPNAHRLKRINAPHGLWRRIDWLLLILILGFLLLPLGLVIVGGLVSLGDLFSNVSLSQLSRAFWSSFLCAAFFALGVVPFSLALAWKQYAALTWLVAAISPLVLSTGFILILRLFMNPFDLGVPLVILIQTLVLSPVFVRLWQGALHALTPEERMTLDSLTLSSKERVKLFYWPRLRPHYARLSVIALALGLGDLALYPLLAPPGFENLPMLIVSLMSSYRFGSAMSLAVLVVLVTGLCLFVGQKWTERWEVGDG